jgi:hypothetical protein
MVGIARLGATSRIKPGIFGESKRGEKTPSTSLFLIALIADRA